jgi:hypothetical protein
MWTRFIAFRLVLVLHTQSCGSFELQYEGEFMSTNWIVRLGVVGALILPALSQAFTRQPASDGVDTVICGHILNTNSPYGQEEQEATGYLVRVNCGLDQKETANDPRAVVQAIKSQDKGVVTRFTKAAVMAAAARGERNPRAAKAYACIAAKMDQNPCVTGAKKVSILEIYEMHASPNVLPTWKKKAAKAMGKTLTAEVQ